MAVKNIYPCNTAEMDVASQKFSSFQHPELLNDWIHTFAANKKVHTVASTHSTTVSLIETRGSVLELGLRKLVSPTNQHLPSYHWPGIESSEDMAHLLEESRRTLHWGILELDLVPERSETHRFLAQLRDQGWPMEIRPWQVSAIVDLDQTPEAYFRSRSKKLRKDMNNAENRLRREGTLIIEEVGSRADWERWLNEALQLEAKGWKGESSTAIIQSRKIRQFYDSMLRQFQARSQLQLFVLLLDGRLLAFSIFVTLGTLCVGLKTSYDPEFARFSPGVILQRGVINKLLADPALRQLDLMYPVSDWKKCWATRTENLLRITVFANNRMGRALLNARALLRHFRVRHAQIFKRAKNSSN